ncbi:MAG TPA: glycosyltransferase [Romboutsia timonensis]|uniref:Glycosyltransferase n=1 Tax=Romboutsia timonensis TaxID=1776391 RepID=A0A921N1S4_9FIRM|nr:glycosyltransferase [Romboutsia timonensis]
MKYIKKIKNYLLWKVHAIKSPFKIAYLKKLKIKKRGISEKRNGNNIIISLTSYTGRFSTLDLCIKSLLVQTIKPNKVILYLAEKDSKKIPSDILSLQQYGLEIRTVSEDYRPHKKYMYAMEEFTDSLIITVDDDAIYSNNLVKALLDTHRKYPNAVVTGRAREIKITNGIFSPYNEWKLSGKREEPSMMMLATGVGGILYPPKLLDVDMVTNREYIEKYIDVDDLWLKNVEILSNIPTVLCGLNIDIGRYDIPSAQKRGLFVKNTGIENNNDKKWNELNKEFKLFNKLKGKV